MHENDDTKKAAKCEFCAALELYKKIDAMSIAKAKESAENMAKYGLPKSSYAAAIVRKSWWSKVGKKGSGRTADFRKNGTGYKLNFCPECGRKITGTRWHKNDVDIMNIK